MTLIGSIVVVGSLYNRIWISGLVENDKFFNNFFFFNSKSNKCLFRVIN